MVKIIRIIALSRKLLRALSSGPAIVQIFSPSLFSPQESIFYKSETQNKSFHALAKSETIDNFFALKLKRFSRFFDS